MQRGTSEGEWSSQQSERPANLENKPLTGGPIKETMQKTQGQKEPRPRPHPIRKRSSRNVLFMIEAVPVTSPTQRMSFSRAYSDLDKSKDLPSTETSSLHTSETLLYSKRWLVLAIFVVYSLSNAMQWIQFSIIANVITKYYGVSNSAVDWTSMIFMVTYIPLIFPASWLLDKLGLRKAILIGSVGTCLGSWIKVFSISPDRFDVTFFGQTVVAISQTFILSLPARVAAVWFGQNEVSSACSIGVFGNQVGVAIGFVLPPLLVKFDENITVIEDGLRLMYYSVAVITTVVVFLVVFFIEDKPDLPPSLAQAAQKDAEDVNDTFTNSVLRLATNKGYILLLVSYGINVGVFYALSTLLNQVILTHFPEGEKDAGIIGLLIVLVGMLGSVICGYILDRTRLFKETTLIVYGCSVFGMVGYTISIQAEKMTVVYITAALLGFFMTGYLPVGFELAAELTYPEPEGTSAGLINAGAQIFGIAFTIMYSKLLTYTNDLWANICLIGMLVTGTLLTAFIPSDLRRQLASHPML